MKLSDAYVSHGQLAPQHVQFYKDYGFLVVTDLLQAEDVAQLKAETAAIFRGERGAVNGLLPVQPGETDEAILAKYVAIHFPNKLSPLIHEYLFHPGVVQVLTQLISPNLKCMQSMLFVKAPGKAGQSWHQDEFYIPTRDRSLAGAWIAVDDAHLENGCLWIIPGSHQAGYIMPRVSNDNKEFADVDTVDIRAHAAQLEAMPVEVKSGSVVFFNGYVLHSSLSNKTTDHFRTALVNHYMSAESMLPWDQDGKVQLTEDLRDIIMVAGQDPYAYKGTVEVNAPFLRPEILRIKTHA